MTRQERRRLEREKNTTYNVSSTQLKQLQEEAFKEAYEQVERKQHNLINAKAKESTRDAFLLMLYLPLWVNRNHLGFGKKRMLSYVEKLVEAFNDWEDGLFSLTDIIDTIEEETGFILEVEPDMYEKETKITLKKND